ncbi:EthD domain-containing protein [Sphingopyxis sp.]|uniref:EthD domain-containing protein n=1 Tax=Sphingopyxis sp. TaxID=1908224 RepID=UPI003D6CF2B2
MVKLILLASRKADTSREEFRAYYEQVHAPLAASVMKHCTRYVRNFVAEEPSGAFGYDVLTEFWFDSEGPWSERRRETASDDVAALLAEDEARFMDRASMRIAIVREAESSPALLLGNRA